MHCYENKNQNMNVNNSHSFLTTITAVQSHQIMWWYLLTLADQAYS